MIGQRVAISSGRIPNAGVMAVQSSHPVRLDLNPEDLSKVLQ